LQKKILQEAPIHPSTHPPIHPLPALSYISEQRLIWIPMAIAFKNTAQEETYNKVGDYLTASPLFKDSIEIDPDTPKFHLSYGSARVDVEVLSWDVHPWDERELAIVRACSCVTTDTPTEAVVMRFLLQENARMRFGSFQLGSNQQILFADTVLGGENMDLMELQACILSVVTIADTYDELIVEKFGGVRGSDRIPVTAP
ncbi:MAG: YbjN domain-containing protein, partial [Oculatellaceae cyanobacterium Prado106]|nr:YbjN domain-containing protein [Oculatellaceae cyanobacterium Prado106]